MPSEIEESLVERKDRVRLDRLDLDRQQKKNKDDR